MLLSAARPSAKPIAQASTPATRLICSVTTVPRASSGIAVCTMVQSIDIEVLQLQPRHTGGAIPLPACGEGAEDRRSEAGEGHVRDLRKPLTRSEEHTSELQSHR